MASDREFVTFVCEQLRGAGTIASRRMFGEAAVYLGDKVVGLVCDNQLFLKPTAAGRAKLGSPTEAPPFPGASNWFLLADLDDPEFLAELVRATADALPAPKLKTKKTKTKNAETKRAKINKAKTIETTEATEATKKKAVPGAKQVAKPARRRR